MGMLPAGWGLLPNFGQQARWRFSRVWEPGTGPNPEAGLSEEPNRQRLQGGVLLDPIRLRP